MCAYVTGFTLSRYGVTTSRNLYGYAESEFGVKFQQISQSER